MDSLMSVKARVLLGEQHASHRIAIWGAFERHIWERAVEGHGFDTSFRIAAQDEGRAPGTNVIDNIHPHNVLLQAWVEFGLLGAVWVSAALIHIFARLYRMSEMDRASRLGFLISAAVVTLVGLNAWAPWWLAVTAVCLGYFIVLRDGDRFPVRPPGQAG